ncbi:MAG: hypothetical protein K2X36_03380, partial [Microbacteriaceae bacterium]|nr:hypothetical protein [Microbacteriaceae bacterium]
MNDAPDLKFDLKAMQLKVRSDGTSVAMAKWVIGGTGVMHVDKTTMKPEELEKLTNRSPISSSASSVRGNDEADQFLSDPEFLSAFEDYINAIDKTETETETETAKQSTSTDLTQQPPAFSSTPSSSFPKSSASQPSTLDNYNGYPGRSCLGDDCDDVLFLLFDEQLNLYREKKDITAAPPP